MLSNTGSGSLVRVSATDFSTTAMNRVCPGALYPLYYPGAGTTVYGQCAEGNTTSILLLNATNLQVLGNVSLGGELYEVSMAADLGHQRLYVSRADAHLWTVDLGNDAVVANVSLPGGPGLARIWFDPSSERLFATSLLTGTIQAVDPATGTLGASVPSYGTPVDVATLDPALGRFYLPYYGSGTSGNGLEVVDTSTLSTVAVVPIPSPSSIQGLFVDRARGEVDLLTGYGIALLNESSNQFLDASLTFAGLPTSALSPYISLEPDTDSYAIVASYQQAVGLALFPALRSYTDHPAWSAFPVVGAQLPLSVATVGTIAALPMLVVGWRLRFGTGHLDLPPAPDVRIPATGGAATAMDREAAPPRGRSEEPRVPPA